MASIARKPNGTFLIRVYDGKKNGKDHYVSVIFRANEGVSPTVAVRSAEKYAILFEELVHSGGYEKKSRTNPELRARRRTTVADFIQNYYYPSIAKHLSPNTCRTYEQIIGNLILPSFGEVELEDINSTHLQNFVDFLSTEGASAAGNKALSPATVKRYATVFSSIIAEAWKMKFIETNPFEHKYINYPKIIQPELEAYNDKEISQFIAALETEDVRTKALLTLAVSTGMRRAELVGLMWSDVNFDSAEIRIVRSVYKPKGEEQKLKTPKSVCSVRTVYMPDSCVRSLLAWKNEQEMQKRKWYENYLGSDFIFTDKTGKPMSVYSPTEICSDFEKRHGLRHLKLHGLRHTCGSLMMAHGADAETVKAILGHESLDTTNKYLHPYEESKRNATGMMECIIRGKADEKNTVGLSSGERYQRI